MLESRLVGRWLIDFLETVLYEIFRVTLRLEGLSGDRRRLTTPRPVLF